MPYYGIEDFKAGIDLRKSTITAPAGTLRDLKNAHITQGGEIEKRGRFEQITTLPSGTFGLMELNGVLQVVKPGVSSYLTAGGVYVIGITMPAGVTATGFLDWDLYDGKLYFVLLGSDGFAHHFYDGLYVPTGKGRNIRTYKEKMYGLEGRTLYFSAIGDPSLWQDPPPDPATGLVDKNGSGFINIGANDADSNDLVSMEVYYDKLAIFSKLACQLWFMDPDPNLNTYQQTLRDAGTIAPNSVRQFVANDVFFLGSHGVRSLRARDQTITAAVSDVGSPVDKIFEDILSTKGETYASKAQSLLNARDGRFLVVFPDEIYVLSNFPSPNITAWGRYAVPGTITNSVYMDPYVFLRDNTDKIWRFGGAGTPSYDSSAVEVVTPWLSFDKPCTQKIFTGIDVACTGSWAVYVGLDPGNAAAEDLIANISGPTFLKDRIPFTGRSTHIRLRFVNESAGGATLSKVFVHYKSSDTD